MPRFFLRDTLVAVVAYNEGEKLKELVKRFPAPSQYRLVFIDDGSTDGSSEWLESIRHHVIRHEQNKGVGASIRTAIEYGRKKGLQVIVIMAGNGTMPPEEIPRLVEPILCDQADYVQGSRYPAGGQSPNLHFLSNIATKLFRRLINLLVGVKGTDITCGFRAYRLSLFDNPNISLNQDWLDRYEMEYYIHYKAADNGYRLAEVPVSMLYPPEESEYSKIRPRPRRGWWSILRLLICLRLGIKK
jgi:dolichol-phosphate mannosyltransferase